MTLFRPCIDLHEGRVKQIIGGTLGRTDCLVTNFVSDHSASYFADMYRQDGLKGGHVIQLGPGNRSAAMSALAAYPGGLQLGGGVNDDNALEWLEAGASHVIVTSWLFDQTGRFLPERLEALSQLVGREHLVVDLSCRAVGEGWVVAKDKWQKLTDLSVNEENLSFVAQYCAELLVHAADVEGKCEGVDCRLIQFLSDHADLPVTYAGGAYAFEDLQRVSSLSRGKIDLTIGSALDVFGGECVRYEDCVGWNQKQSKIL